jgi:hypothetical protein
VVGASREQRTCRERNVLVRSCACGLCECMHNRYAPQVRSLRRGADRSLLGLMLPLTAFEGDVQRDTYASADSDESATSVFGDDVPVLEVDGVRCVCARARVTMSCVQVMCEVKSVLRTPFFASTFDSVVESP